MKKLISISLALIMMVSLFACSAKTPADNVLDGGKQSGTANDPAVGGGVIAAESTAHFAKDYDEVYGVFASFNSGSDYMGADRNEAVDAPAEDSVMDDSTEAAPETGGAGDGGDKEHSDTNVQVDGIDEGDIVKTDGDYIYVLSYTDLVIYKVNGADVKEVSRSEVGESIYGDGENRYSYKEKSPVEMYVDGDRAAVVFNYWSHDEWKNENGEWGFESENYALVEIYDISDKTAPKQIASLGQDGNIVSTRAVGGKLYAVTNYYVYDEQENDVNTFIPRVYDDGKATVLPADVICLPTQPSKSYAVAAEYDLTSGKQIAVKAVMAAADRVYMDKDQLVIAGGKNGIEASETRKESVYEVVDYINRSTTELTVFDASKGGLEYRANAVINGYLDSQFAIDGYNGYFRFVTTENSYSYTTYTDKEMGFVNTKWHDDHKQSNSLYILDKDLNVVGSLTNLAENERVYSVRFDGDIVYFCTFRETDPLFTVDVSDPTNPVILSALKIPGFSEYLHVWTEGELLFGLGQDTREESYGEETWVTTDGMKLSMFDVSDPSNVTEKWKLSLDSDYSEALYNHKAIIVSAEKNLIGFPADGGYSVYGFDSDRGFYKITHIAFDFGWNSRGLWIEDVFYIVSSEKITVLDMKNFSVVNEITVIK